MLIGSRTHPGSSSVQRWMAAPIIACPECCGYHHIHQLNSRIPNYHLAACHDAEPALQQVVTLGLRDSLRCPSLKLWDEQSERMVTFAEALQHSRPAPYAVLAFVVRRSQLLRNLDQRGSSGGRHATVAPQLMARDNVEDRPVSQRVK